MQYKRLPNHSVTVEGSTDYKTMCDLKDACALYGHLIRHGEVIDGAEFASRIAKHYCISSSAQNHYFHTAVTKAN